MYAFEEAWIEVHNANGDLIVNRTLHKGEQEKLPDLQGLTLTTGNAGGLSVTVDGKKVPRLGYHSQVVRDVNLSPDEMLHGNTGNN